MSDFLNYTAGLHILEKQGENARALDRQNSKIKDQNYTIEKQRLEKQRQDIELGRVKGIMKFEKENAERAKDEAEYYQLLLSKPMKEIAEAHLGFKETYNKQQELLADWIVSQRAFKELAMKYGKLAGKTPEEIQQEGMEAKEIILTDQSQFGNNIEEGTAIHSLKKPLLEKLRKNKKK